MDDVPDAIQQVRRNDAEVSIERMCKPEVVMRYAKDVKLDDRAIIQRLHVDDYDVNDIIRFSFARFLRRADDPHSELPVYDEAEDRVDTRAFRKVYHVNIVLAFHTPSVKKSQPTFKRVRVVFDKNRIRRLDEVC
jgi:hypothetical protein